MTDVLRLSLLSFTFLALAACQSEGEPSRYDSSPQLTSSSSHRQLLGLTDAESCTENAEGNFDCVWEGPGMSCTYGVSANDELLYQYCSGPWGEYDCLNTGGEIVCDYAADGGACTDVWSLEYELIDSTCDYGYWEPEEECVTGEDGMTTCTWSDGRVDCVVIYDATGNLVSQECTEEGMQYNCTGSGEVVECVMVVDGEVICTDTWTQAGEPIELGCSEEPAECPGAPGCEEVPPADCSTDATGNTTCVENDGYVECTYSYDVNGIITFVDCDSSDGWMSYDCAVDDADGLLHCLYREGEETCEDIVENNEIVSSTCEWDDPGDEPSPPDVPDEWSCERNDDGSETCLYDDGCITCTVLIGADGITYEDECTDGTYSSACAGGVEQVTCSMYLGGELLCTDVMTAEGEPIEQACTDYYDDWGATCGG